MNLLLPRSDRRRFFSLSDFQSNALHGDINKTLKMLLSPFFLTSTAAKPINNAAVPLRTFLSGNEYPSNRCRRPPLIPLRKHKPLKRRRRPPPPPLQASDKPSAECPRSHCHRHPGWLWTGVQALSNFRRVSAESPPPPPSSSSLKQAFRRVAVESPPPPPRLALDRCTSVERASSPPPPGGRGA